MNSNFSLWQEEDRTLVKLFLILKEPFHFLSPMCKMYSKSVYYFNDITLSWIWKIFFLDKTHLYWFSDYLLFLLTMYYYSINSWSVGHWVTILTNINEVLVLEALSVGWWKRRISGSQTQEHNWTKWSAPLHVHTIIKNLEKELSCWSMAVAIVNYLHLFHGLIPL